MSILEMEKERTRNAGANKKRAISGENLDPSRPHYPYSTNNTPFEIPTSLAVHWPHQAESVLGPTSNSAVEGSTLPVPGQVAVGTGPHIIYFTEHTPPHKTREGGSAILGGCQCPGDVMLLDMLGAIVQHLFEMNVLHD